MKKWNKLLALLLAMVMAFSMTVTAFAEGEETTETTEAPAAEETTETETPAETPAVEPTGVIKVYYTNDVHTYVDNGDEEEAGLRYSNVAAIKDAAIAAGDAALLVDAGDHAQGTAYGSMDRGETIIKLMNAAGYDAATLGNHEFDYGMDGCMNLINWADYSYLSCNFYNEKNGVAGEGVLDSYKVFELAGKKVAIVGVTTPESFTKSTPAYFQNEDGEYIYGIAGGDDGAALYDSMQKAIDAASAEADYVIGLGHLGTDASSEPWTSEKVIANTTGLDAFIDGHSHSTVATQEVADKDGNPVVLTQTGDYLGAVGEMTIAADGTITTKLLTAADVAEIAPDADVKAIEDAWIAEINTQLGEVIGFADVELNNMDADGNRLVRKQETNTGAFAADALYYLFDNMDMDVDLAIMNGGGVRNKTAITGELSYLSCKEIHTFGNVACLITVTGQQILDALEWGAKDAAPDGSKENGGLLHVSGVTYTIDTTIPSTVQKDEKGVWTGAPTGKYRVKDVMILNNETGEYEALDLAAEYNMAGYNYTLRDMGDGFAMFGGAVNVLDYVMEDYMVLANYIKSFAVNEETGLPTITAESGYDKLTGFGRITLKTEPTLIAGYTDVTEAKWFADAVAYADEKGLIDGLTETTFGPNEAMTRADFVTALYRLAGSPEVTAENVFTDVADDAAYKNAVIWAAACGYVDGMTETTFAPDGTLQRQQIAAILYRAVKPEAAEGDLSVFVDADKVQSYAIEAVKWMVATTLLKGNDDNTIDARGAITRAQAATILMRFEEMGLTFAAIEETEETETVPAEELTPAEPVEKTFETIPVTVKNGDRDVPAVITMPVGEGPFAAVVLNHGHGGSKDENVGFIGIAEALAEAGIASIRMDFPGCGESTEPFTEENLTNRISDSNACKDYLVENYNIDADKLGILGYSMGGRTAAMIAGEENNPYQAMVLLAGAVGSGVDMAYGTVGGEENYAAAYETAKTEGKYTVTTIYGQVLDYSAKWFDDMMASKPLENAANFDGPVLVIYGDEDVVVPAEVNKLSLEAYSNATEIVVPGANHSYGFYDPMPEVTVIVEGSIVDFFAESLADAVEAAA